MSETEVTRFRGNLIEKQAWLYCGLCLVLLVALFIAGPPSLAVQVFVMAPLVVLLGLPHGTTDVWDGQTLFRPRFGRAWWVPFGVGYLLLSGFVVLVWNHFPEVSLGLFLIASAAHFGACDSIGDWHGSFRILNVLSRGLAPITLPTLIHGTEVEAAFGALHVVNPALLMTLLRWLAIFSIVGLSVTGVRNLIGFKGSRRIMGAEPFFEIALLTFAPPILGFGISFAFLHSSRHLIDFWAGFRSEVSAGSGRWVLGSSVAVWVLTVGLGAAFFLLNPVGGVSNRLIYVVFVGLAALTLPHMILEILRSSKLRTVQDEKGRGFYISPLNK